MEKPNPIIRRFTREFEGNVTNVYTEEYKDGTKVFYVKFEKTPSEEEFQNLVNFATDLLKASGFFK